MLSNNDVSAWIASKPVEERAKIFKAARALAPVQEALAKSRQASVREYIAEQMKLKAQQKRSTRAEAFGRMPTNYCGIACRWWVVVL